VLGCVAEVDGADFVAFAVADGEAGVGLVIVAQGEFAEF